MPPKESGFETLVDNDAVLALDIRLAAGLPGPVTRSFRNALFVGMEDGTGLVMVEGGASPRYVPIARGRVDWLGDGCLEVRAGNGFFGRGLLVEIRTLPTAEGIARTFGDRVLLSRGDFCVYEEIIGPAQVRVMHNHGPRLVICLSTLHTRNTLPGNEKMEVKRDKGTVVWNAKAVTHEVMNAAAEPFWCMVVEHP
jgi:hypothetical protein